MFYSNTESDATTLGIASVPSIPPSEDDEEYTVINKYHHRPDIMANDIYGSPKYWFVFLLRNMDRMEDPIFDLEAGMKIMVPHPSNVRRL